MTVVTTIQQMMDRYPELFRDRYACYRHLFCVTGNGYKWRRGQLVECEDEFTKEDEIADYAINHIPIKQTKETVREYEKFKQDCIELNSAFKKKYSNSWYSPISEYSCINHVPKNVKIDWLNAAKEYLKILKENVKS